MNKEIHVEENIKISNSLELPSFLVPIKCVRGYEIFQVHFKMKV